MIHFPVILPVKGAKIIKHIHSRIWDGYGIEDEEIVLLDEEWIPDEPTL